MKTSNHKGNVRIDTPPPNIELENNQSKKSHLSGQRSPVQNEKQLKSKVSRRRSALSYTRYSKADTKYRPRNDFDLRLTKNDSLELVRKRRPSLKS